MNERRRYFRIDDTIGLGLRIIDQAEAEQLERLMRIGQRRSSDMVQLFHGLEVQFNQALEELRNVAPQSAMVADLLNEKINIVGRMMVDTQLKTKGGTQAVNLSACGLAFDSEEPMDVGTLLEVELTLFPSYTFIVLLARVVDCPQTKHGYNIRLDFVFIRDEEQEALIHHMVQRQGEVLRQMRTQEKPE